MPVGLPVLGGRRRARGGAARAGHDVRPGTTTTSSAPTATSWSCRTTGWRTSAAIVPEQVALAAALGVPTVATNDLHYTLATDAKPHDVLLCIQQQKLQSDPKRLRFDAEEFYLKTPKEMRRTFAELPEACDATLAIAERIQPIEQLEEALVRGETRYHLPRFDTPGGEPHEAYLRRLVASGADGPLRGAAAAGGPRPTRPRARASSSTWGSPATS